MGKEGIASEDKDKITILCLEDAWIEMKDDFTLCGKRYYRPLLSF